MTPRSLLALLLAAPLAAAPRAVVPLVTQPVAPVSGAMPAAFSVAAAAQSWAAAMASPSAALAPIALAPSAALSAAPIAAVAAAIVPPAAPAERALETLKGLAGAAPAVAGFDGARVLDGFVVNDEGVQVSERAARYYQEVRRLVEEYKGKIDLEESLDVMDDSYGDVVSKLTAMEALAKVRRLDEDSVSFHLPFTLSWVDGVFEDRGKRIAVATHRVYFHHAKNPSSEIAEGIRRLDGALREAERHFSKSSLEKTKLGRVDQVELVYDVRGYPQIKQHLKAKAAELFQRSGGYIQVRYLDELAPPVPTKTEEVRARLNQLVTKYKDRGAMQIIEGVIYSRYVGLLLELKGVEDLHKRGYKILQSGRELFDKNGQYVTELDIVAESPQGVVELVEAKSARVRLNFNYVLRTKVLNKLDTYKKHKAALDAMIGKPFQKVVFVMDFGVPERLDPRAHSLMRSSERRSYGRSRAMMDQLRAMEPELSAKYGFPVSFTFLESMPMEPDEDAEEPESRPNARARRRR